MLNSLKGYYKMQTLENGVVNPVWVEYPTAVKLSKWVCLLCLIGIVLAFIGSLVPAYQAYGLEGVKYAITNITNLIFVPVAILCIMGLKLKG